MNNVLQKQLLSKFAGLLSKETAEIIDFLKIENQILRSKLSGRVFFTEYDRRLLIKHGIPIKHRLHEFISIVKPETLLSWNRKMKKEKWTYNNSLKGPGRPKKGKETE